MASNTEGDNSVPGLPSEWGRIVIPDDVSELDELADQVCGELYIEEEQRRFEKRLPFIVLAATVVITLAGLFLVPWVGQVGEDPAPQQPATTSQSTGSADTVTNTGAAPD